MLSYGFRKAFPRTQFQRRLLTSLSIFLIMFSFSLGGCAKAPKEAILGKWNLDETSTQNLKGSLSLLNIATDQDIYIEFDENEAAFYVGETKLSDALANYLQEKGASPDLLRGVYDASVFTWKYSLHEEDTTITLTSTQLGTQTGNFEFKDDTLTISLDNQSLILTRRPEHQEK